MVMTDSPEQSLFYDALAHTTGNLMLVACAGSGKTTTFCRAIPHIPDVLSKSVLFLSFGKDIVTTLVDRVPPYCQCKTFNALGHAVWQQHIGRRLTIETGKIRSLLKDGLKWKEFELAQSPVCKLIGVARNYGLGITGMLENTYDSWFMLMDRFGIYSDNPDELPQERIVQIAQQCLRDSIIAALDGHCDFDDQLYMPVLKGLHFTKWNYVFVDEAQDTNNVQREIVRRLLAPTSRLIVAGDPSQAIYGFRGADTESMQRFRDEFNMTVMNLSVSWRCAKAITREASKYITTL